MSREPPRCDPTKRFSSRVDEYVRYRPDYPDGIVVILEEEGTPTGSVLADIGSGTGISSELLLRHGYTVFGVEPNPEMRRAAERLLQAYPAFRSVAAAAEDTTLPSGSVDAIVAAQAFHWFDPAKAQQEFVRILKPNGIVMLIWNERRVDATPFLEAYENLLLRFGVDYREVDHRRIGPDELEPFFGTYRKRVLAHEQVLDRPGLRGRIVSSSYMPAPGERGHEAMLREIDHVFSKYEKDGFVRVLYDTVVYVGAPDGT